MRKIRFLNLVHPASFFTLLYFFYLGLIIPLSYFFNIGNVIENTSNLTLFIVIIFILFFLLGAFLLAPNIFHYKPKIFSSSLKIDVNINKTYLIVFFFLFAFIIIHLYYFYRIGFVPAFSADVATVRVSAKKGYGSFLLIANGMAYASILLMVIIHNYVSKSLKLLNYCLLFIFVLFIYFEGFRGPAAYLFLLFSLGLYFQGESFMKKRKISMKIILLSFSFVVFLSVLDVIRSGLMFNLSSLNQIFWTMTVNLYNLNDVVKYFNHNDYLYGQSFVSDLMVAIPGFHSEFMGVKMVKLLGLSFLGEGMTITAPGEAYLNFGLCGVIIYAILLGCIADIVFQSLISNRLSSFVLLVFFSFCFSKIAVAGIMPTIIFTVLPTFVFLYPALIYIRNVKLQ
jgi:oligosaccharide repeat unit polymerase